MSATSASSSQKEGILAQNTIINVIGKIIPLLFAIVALPFVIDGLGTDRFGVLTLVWMVIGYFGLLDMGLGRATTKFVADQEAKDAEYLSPIIITSVVLLFCFGVIGGGLIFFSTPYLVNYILNVPADLEAETQMAFYILSGAIPIVLGSLGAQGVLEAQQRFKLVNAVKIPASIINYVSPLLILPFSNHLQYVVSLLVVERIISFAIYLYYCFQDQPVMKFSEYSFIKWAKKLLSFGAWLTISNFISPIMVYMDRFIIGAILTMSAVAYYTTPYEIVSRFSIISSGFMGVMFPAFSVYFLQDQKKLLSLYQKSIRYLLFVLIPTVTFFIFAANPLLYLWIGQEFAINSTAVLQILAIGVLVNSIAMVPSTLIQAAGRPDIRAKLHMAELPIYLGLLWYMTRTFGIKGVALTWLFRVVLDCAMMFYFSNSVADLFKIAWHQLVIKITSITALVLAAAFGYWWINNKYLALLYAAICGLITLYITWRYMLRQPERDRIWELTSEVQLKLKN